MSPTEPATAASLAPSEASGDRLYALLPAVYRVRDAAHGQQLRALLRVIGRELQVFDEDIERLYDNWFVETCAEWVVPYVGDLLGVRSVSSIGTGIARQRAFVANTLRYRQGKGTIDTLEQVARDLSGWPAHAVESFLLLATTQNLNHLRLDRPGMVDMRDRDTLDRIGSPFDGALHVADVRHIDTRRGRFNIPNVGVFLWRLQAYPIEGSPAVPAGEGRYRFSPLGHDAPLFIRPATQASVAQIASETKVPGPLRPGALSFDLRAYRERFDATDPAARPDNSTYYGPDRSFFVVVDGDPARPIEVVCADLAAWDRPPPGRVAVDVRLGRLSFAEGEDPAAVRLSFAYGFPADLGGGPYDRRATLADPGQAAWTRTVSATDPAADFTTLGAALAAWADPDDGAKGDGVITLTGNHIYAEQLALEPAASSLVIQAANGVRPLLRLAGGDGEVGELVVSGGAGAEASLALNGVLVEGGIRIEGDSLGKLGLSHCTLVPGRSLDPSGRPREPDRPSLVAEAPNERLQVILEHSIVGPVRLPADARGLSVLDGIIDSPGARRVPVLVSGPLSPFPTLSSPTPSVEVSIGSEGPRTATLGTVPTTLPEARDLLQTAIRASSETGLFAGAVVISRRNRLVVVPGSAEPVRIGAAGADSTAGELQLDASSARTAAAMVAAIVVPFPALSSAAPEVGVTMRAQEPRVASLGSVPTSIAQARDELESAIRDADADPAFADALVVDLAGRLAIVPGTVDGSVRFMTSADDQTTVVELGLLDRVAAIASPVTGPRGESPGPPSTLERATVFGGVLVRQLTLASDAIFTASVIAERRQVGCTRFSFVPRGSRVPRRHHCQPAPGSEVVPQFTSIGYGHPGYAQLGVACPPEITAGADDEGEMGAFNLLRQAQRLENLHNGLEQYLPFGLEAGVHLVT